VTQKAGLASPRKRWGTGCAFVDYDRDGRLDILAANYIDMELETTPTPDSGLCRYKGVPVACGPPGLTGGKNVLFRNKGDGTFADVSEAAGITSASGTYGLGVSTLDFDDDGWTDVYVANDSNPSTLYRNKRDGTFEDVAVMSGCAFSQDGKPQAGMGVAVGDYDRNGTMDIFKTNFAGDTATLYRNTGDGFCEDRTFAAGIGTNTRWLGWGTAFVDFANDGWLDLFLVNGHVYPEVEQLKTEAGYKQRKIVYRNRRDGRFEDVSERLGEPVTTPKAGRGAAFGDLDNDGDVDVVVNNVHDTPDLFRDEPTRRTTGWPSRSRARARTAARSAPACAAARAASPRRRRCAAAAATTRRTTCACTSAWAPAARWSGSRCAGRTGSRRMARPGGDRIHTLREGTGTAVRAKADADRRVRARVASAALPRRRLLPRRRRRTSRSAARALIDAGPAEAAVEALQPFRPANDPNVELAAGVAYYHAGDAVRAVDALAKVVTRLPTGSLARREAVQVLGLANYLAGRIADAIPYLEETRAFAPGNTELAYALGMAYIQTRQPEKARAIWSAAFGVGADTAAAHVLNAQMMVRAELDEMAEAELKLALAKDPRLPHANFLLGQTALFRGRLDDAVRSEEGAGGEPGSAMALYRLGDAYVAPVSSGTRRSPRCRSRSGSTPPSAGPTSCSARPTRRRASRRLRRACCAARVEYDPNNKSAHYLLAQLLQQTGAPTRRSASSRSPSACRTRPIAEACAAAWLLPGLLLAARARAGAEPPAPWPVRFVDVAARAGLTRPSVYGGLEKKRFIIETNGAGSGVLRRRRRWLGRRAGAERHAARGRRAAGGDLAEGRGASEPPVSQQPRRDVSRRDRAGGFGKTGFASSRVRRRLRQRRGPRPVRDLLRPERPSTATSAAAASRTSPARRGSRRRATAGDQDAASSTTTATGGSTCSSRTTCRSTSRRRRSPARARAACGRAFPSTAGPTACPSTRTCSITRRRTGFSVMFRGNRASAA
jgi:tetratricopeptide (TPR) repeat protein